MPSLTSIIDTIATPPLASLQQVLDTHGPFAAGDHAIDSFHTDGAFLLAAGDYFVSNTYGVVVRVTTFPAAAGRQIGFNGLVHGQDQDQDVYHDNIAQVNLFHQFPVSGAYYPTQVWQINMGTTLLLWPGYIGSAVTVGLHVFPNYEVDLYWMCVL